MEILRQDKDGKGRRPRRIDFKDSGHYTERGPVFDESDEPDAYAKLSFGLWRTVFPGCLCI
jgi:hypothetical protein